VDKRKVAAGLLLLTGGVWFLQGINVFPGSFMTGNLRWAVAGILFFASGYFLWKKKA
jgi:hypothetical protein